MKTIDYKNFGKCCEIERNGWRALITLDIGPRIIFYGKSFNLLNEDIDRNVSKNLEINKRKPPFGNELPTTEGNENKDSWYLYGGHRVWAAPECEDTYVPDNYPVEAEYTEFGGTFKGLVHINGLQFSLKVEMNEDGSLEIDNIVENTLFLNKRIAVWSLTVAKNGGTMFANVGNADRGYLPNASLTEWGYNDPEDERLKRTKSFVAVRQTAKERALKVGFYAEDKTVYYHVDGTLFIKDFGVEKIDDEAHFYDFGSNLECYTNQYIIELEGLTKARNLEPKAAATLHETWRAIENFKILGHDDAALQAAVDLAGHIK